MKKALITLTLVLAMALTLATPTFAAQTVTQDNGTAEIPVTGKYNGEFSDAPERVSVDVAWGAMTFTYNAVGTKTWDPETHQDVENKTSGTWTANCNDVTVTNHSNTAVTAKLTFAGADGITGTFKNAAENGEAIQNDTLSLATAVGTTVANAPKATAYLIVDGSIAGDQSLGTITVTIKNAD